MVTPDDKMTVPIDRLVFWAARCVHCVLSIRLMSSEQLEMPEVQAFARREDEFVHAYRVALMLRAWEVARFCDRIGLHGCTVEMVRDNPFLVVMAIDRHLQGGAT